VLAGGLLLLARLGPTTSPLGITLPLAVAGLGIGVFISPNTSALLGAAPLQRRGIASGILAAARNVGMVLGVGLAGAIFTSVLNRQGNSGMALYAALQASFIAAAAISIFALLITFLRD
jgi:hypothetical protein